MGRGVLRCGLFDRARDGTDLSCERCVRIGNLVISKVPASLGWVRRQNLSKGLGFRAEV